MAYWWQKLLFNTHADTYPATASYPMNENFADSSPSAISWDPSECQAIRHYQTSKRLCTADIGDSRPRQSVVLHFDSDTGTMIIDDLFPSPVEALQGQVLTLHFACERQRLAVDGLVLCRWMLDEKPAYRLQIFQKRLLSDRRQSLRVHFDGIRQPKAELLIPMIPRLRGILLEMSLGGFTLNCPGAAPQELSRDRAECHLVFCHNFELKCTVQIQQFKIRRKPCRHTLIRAQWLNLSEAQSQQLLCFLKECQAASGQGWAA